MSEQITVTGVDSFELSDVAHIEMGQSPDSRYVVEDPFQGLAFLQGNAEFGTVYPEPKFGCLRPAKKCKVNDVLISVRAPVGAINLADRDYCIGRGLAAIQSRGIKPSLLGEVVARQSAALRRVAQGTTFEAISKKDLLTLKLNLPPKADWPQIAEILDTLDVLIHETEAIIAKLKAVKQGLLHDLLTRGIDINGELRPPQAEAPHLYKRSDQGWIPQDWDVRPLSEYTASEITYGIVQAGPHVPNGIPYIRTGDMSGDYLVRETMLCTSQRIASSYSRSEVRSGDIVMAIRATVGKVLPVPSNLDGANLTQGTAKISPNMHTDGTFLLWAIRHSRTQQAIQHEIKGTTFAEITLKALRQVPVAAPVQITEQQEIGKRLTAIEEQLQSEQLYLAKTYAEKSGLMEDLLTGRVRVTNMLPQIDENHYTDQHLLLLELCHTLYEVDQRVKEEYRQERLSHNFIPELLIKREGKIRVEIRKENVSHNEPHLHISHSDQFNVSISLKDFSILAGSIKPRVLKSFIEKLIPFKEKLMDIWNELNEKDNSVAAEILIKNLNL